MRQNLMVNLYQDRPKLENRRYRKYPYNSQIVSAVSRYPYATIHWEPAGIEGRVFQESQDQLSRCPII